MSSDNITTTRRRLDFGRKRNAPRGSTAPIAARSLSSSFAESYDILPPHAIKNCVDFYASASPPDEHKTVAVQQEELHVINLRNVVQEGPHTANAADYAPMIREALFKRVEEQLKSDEWMFSGVPIEKEI